MVSSIRQPSWFNISYSSIFRMYSWESLKRGKLPSRWSSGWCYYIILYYITLYYIIKLYISFISFITTSRAILSCWHGQPHRGCLSVQEGCSQLSMKPTRPSGSRFIRTTKKLFRRALGCSERTMRTNIQISTRDSITQSQAAWVRASSIVVWNGRDLKSVKWAILKLRLELLVISLI